MAGQGLGRFQVGLKNRVVKIARTDKAAGVHVHRGQRLGLVNDQVAAALEVHPAPQRLGDFFVNRVQVKNRPLALVMLQFFDRLGHELGAKRLQGFKLLARIHANGLSAFAHQVAQHALQQIQVLVQQAHGRQLERRALNARPGLAQIGNVVAQFGVLRVFGVGAQDKTAALAAGQGLHALAQLFTLGQRYFL